MHIPFSLFESWILVNKKKNLKFNAIQFIILWWVFYFFVLCLNIFLFWNHEHILFIELNVLTCSSSRLVGPCVYVGMAPVSTVPVELYLVSYPQCGWRFSFRLWEGCHPPSAPRLLWWAVHVMNQVSVYALSCLEGFFWFSLIPPCIRAICLRIRLYIRQFEASHLLFLQECCGYFWIFAFPCKL